jgi:AcrR family transcriptional regulator
MSTTSTSARRQPVQARSKARVDAVLDAAAELIGERGIGPTTMTDIAERAQMPVTAIYRYFPNKPAVVRELTLRVLAHDTEALVRPLTETVDSPRDQIRTVVAEYCRRHLDEPHRMALRAAIFTDAELNAADLADTRRNAAALTEAAIRFSDGTDHEALQRTITLAIVLLDGLVRLVAATEDESEREAQIDDFSALVAARL